MAATLQEYRTQLAELPEDSFLGSLVLFSIHNRPTPRSAPGGARFALPGTTGVTRDQLELWFNDLLLDQTHLPKPIKPIDAFRKATGSDTRCTYTEPYEAELRFREVRNDRDVTVRHLVREVKDRKGAQLHYEPCVGEAIFYKQGRNAAAQANGGSSVRFSIREQTLLPEELPIVQAFIDSIHATYRDQLAHYDSYAIRWVVRDYTQALNAISVSGGLYFVHRSRQATVDALTELVEERVGNGSMYHTVPLVDTDKQRVMLSDAYQDEMEGWADKLLGQVAEVNEKYQGKPVPATVYTKLNDAYQDAQNRAEEHTRLLGRAQERAAGALETSLIAMMDLATRLQVAP